MSKTFYEVRHSDRAGYYFIDRHEPKESFTEVVLDGSEDAATKVCTIVEERAALHEQNKELLEALKSTLPELKELMEWWDREADSFEDNEKKMCQNNVGDVRQKIHNVKTILSKLL